MLLLQVVGFSGTVDNRSLLPLQVEVQDTGDPSIRGTDGRMTSTLLLPGKCTFKNLSQHVPAAEQASTSVSMQVLQFAIDHDANAIIDAGVPAHVFPPVSAWPRSSDVTPELTCVLSSSRELP